ncbi:hypothetical protein LG293_17085 (plasmid) [Citricoccus nitrophenolicus]
MSQTTQALFNVTIADDGSLPIPETITLDLAPLLQSDPALHAVAFVDTKDRREFSSEATKQLSRALQGAGMIRGTVQQIVPARGLSWAKLTAWLRTNPAAVTGPRLTPAGALTGAPLWATFGEDRKDVAPLVSRRPVMRALIADAILRSPINETAGTDDWWVNAWDFQQIVNPPKETAHGTVFHPGHMDFEEPMQWVFEWLADNPVTPPRGSQPTAQVPGTLNTMKLHALLETLPVDSSGSGERQLTEKTVEAETYDQAYAQLRSEVPEGWRLVNVRRDVYGQLKDQYGRTA